MQIKSCQISELETVLLIADKPLGTNMRLRRSMLIAPLLRGVVRRMAAQARQQPPGSRKFFRLKILLQLLK